MITNTCAAAFLPPPIVSFKDISGWGSFSWSNWKLRLNKKYTDKADIKYGKFVEYCTTIYHETRHSEQFYRIAQGLLLGRLKYPDATKGDIINSASGGFRDKIAMFGGSRATSQGRAAVAPSDMLPSVQTVAQWLSIPTNIATHANRHKNSFTTFCAAAKPAWFTRSSTLLEVEDWMRATYKKTYSEMDSFAQAEDDTDGSIRRNLYKMYRSLPEERDAHAIEEVVDSLITTLIGTPDRKNERRSAFTP